MEQQVYFIVNHEELVLDKVLVEYNEEPIFFVCKHEQKYYLALCADKEEERYIVTRTTLIRLSKILHERMTMREAILHADEFWDIVVGEDVIEDIVVEKNMNQIPMEVLPYEGAYLKVVTRELKEYKEKIDSILFGEGKWDKSIPQKYTEYVEGLAKNIYEQYETVFQNVYESVFEPISSEFVSIYDKNDYYREICNLKVRVSNLSTELDVRIASNEKFPFAA